MKFGPWLERLETIAVGRELVATGGWRDTPAPLAGRAHVIPVTLLDDKGAGWSLATNANVRALAFAGDELLVTGGDDGRLLAWDTTGQKQLAQIELGSPVRALAVDAAVARGDAGQIAAGTLDGSLHVLAFSIRDGAPVLAPSSRRALSDGAIGAVAFDPAGLVVAGGADGQLWIAPGR